MSASNTDSGYISTSSLDALIHPPLNGLMIMHSFLMLLIPLVIALFYYSTPQSRRRTIFILNLAAIFLGFVQGVLTDAYAIHSILEPLNPWPLAFNIIVGFIIVCQYLVVDVTLLVRLISVYPPSDIGLFPFALLIAIPVLLKITRVANIILFTKAMVSAMDGPNPAVMMAVVFTTKPYLKIEWGAQMVDNTYASLAFLWKIRRHGSGRVDTNSSRVTLAQRMQTLFRIALTNFTIPALFSIAQFVCVFRNVNAVALNQIVQVNTMLATFGVTFATIWAGNTYQQEAKGIDSKRNNVTSRLMVVFGLGSGQGSNQSSTVMVADSESKSNSRDDIKT